MGGTNSGTWSRCNSKKTIESVKRIDIRYLHKHKLLKPGFTSSLSWTTRGKPDGNIQYSCFDDCLILTYRFRNDSEEWLDIQKKVMTIMPIALTFLFLTFPAGLVLYWVVNNVLSMAQQWYINKKFA